jgi:hypothetical protein
MTGDRDFEVEESAAAECRSACFSPLQCAELLPQRNNLVPQGEHLLARLVGGRAQRCVLRAERHNIIKKLLKLIEKIRFDKLVIRLLQVGDQGDQFGFGDFAGTAVANPEIGGCGAAPPSTALVAPRLRRMYSRM